VVGSLDGGRQPQTRNSVVILTTETAELYYRSCEAIVCDPGYLLGLSFVHTDPQNSRRGGGEASSLRRKFGADKLFYPTRWMQRSTAL
jgi:hypothetical protein